MDSPFDLYPFPGRLDFHRPAREKYFDFQPAFQECVVALERKPEIVIIICGACRSGNQTRARAGMPSSVKFVEENGDLGEIPVSDVGWCNQDPGWSAGSPQVGFEQRNRLKGLSNHLEGRQNLEEGGGVVGDGHEICRLRIARLLIPIVEQNRHFFDLPKS
jgi:hypothetical protein